MTLRVVGRTVYRDTPEGSRVVAVARDAGRPGEADANARLIGASEEQHELLRDVVKSGSVSSDWLARARDVVERVDLTMERQDNNSRGGE